MGTNKIKTLLSYVAVASVMLMCASGAYAQQNAFQGRFTLPYEVHWSNAVLPPGEYSIVVPLLGLPGVVHPAKGGRDLRISIGHPGDMETANSTYLTAIPRDGVLRVVSMNLPSLKLSLAYAPMNESEHKSQVAMRFPLR